MVTRCHGHTTNIPRRLASRALDVTGYTLRRGYRRIQDTTAAASAAAPSTTMTRQRPSRPNDFSCHHWRRQPWGTGGRAPLDLQLVILGITRFTDSDENVQKQRDFCAIFINFWPIFVIFCPQFSSGSNYSSQNAGTIANKFQLHTHFRFR